MKFKRLFWKKALISTSVASFVLISGLSTGLITRSDQTVHTTHVKKENNNEINYHQEIVNNTPQLKNTIQTTKRSDLLEMINHVNNTDSQQLKTKTQIVKPNASEVENHDKQYSFENLSNSEKDKIVDFIYDIGSGKININDLITQAEKESHQNINDLISDNVKFEDNSSENLLIQKSSKVQLKNQAYQNNRTNYSYEEIQALASFVDPDYLKHLRDRSKYLISYATILGVATAAAWGMAAYYWSCWWWFGGNVPFAIAATVQAGLMTADVGVAWADYAFNEEMINHVVDFWTRENYLILRQIYVRGIAVAKIWNFLSKNEILYDTGNNIKNTILWMKDVRNIFLKKAAKTIVAKTGIKAGIAGTSWASPIGFNVISAISFILNISNLIVNFVWR